MLIAQMAQSWLRLRRAQEAEERYFETRQVLDAIANDSETYKAVTRYVADCERAWRHAMVHLEKSQRRRQQAGGFSPTPAVTGPALLPKSPPVRIRQPPESPRLSFPRLAKPHHPDRRLTRFPPRTPVRASEQRPN